MSLRTWAKLNRTFDGTFTMIVILAVMLNGSLEMNEFIIALGLSVLTCALIYFTTMRQK